MLNCYIQWLNIKGKNAVVLISVMLAFNHKKDAIKETYKNILSLCCMYIVHLKIECEIIAI